MNSVIEIHILQESGESTLQILFYVDFLLIDGFNLNKFELIIAGKQKGKREKIEILIFLYVFSKGSQRIDDIAYSLTVKFNNWNFLLLFIAEIEKFEVFAGKRGLATQLLCNCL